MRENNKGFTLIEVLVAITIMGIITVMALPGVQQLQSSNREKKYEKYAESLVSSTKLYVDSNEEDIFGYSVSGCAIIKFDELETKALVKDYETNGVSCAGNGSLGETFVRVDKKGSKYEFTPFITCSKNGKLEYQTQENVEQCTPSSPGIVNSGTLSASITVTDESTWTKRKTVTVKISTTSSGLMLSRYNRVSYCMATYDSSTNKYTCVGNKESLSLNLSSNQKEIVLTEEVGSNLSGEYYFVLFPGEGQIADYAGNILSEDIVSNRLKFDNTAPKITKIIKIYNGINYYGFNVYYEKNDTSKGSEVHQITYSFDNYSENERFVCQIVNLIGFNSDCEVRLNPFLIGINKSNVEDNIYFKITDKVGNSSVYEFPVSSQSKVYE